MSKAAYSGLISTSSNAGSAIHQVSFVLRLHNFAPVRWLVLISIVLPSAFSQTASLDHDYVEAHFSKARRAEASSNFAEAAREYDLILRRYPSAIPELYQNAGIAYYLDHNYQAAIDRFGKGLRLQAHMLGSRLFLGASYLYSGRPRQSLPYLLAAHQANPSVESADYLGLAYSALGDYRPAAEEFRFCLQHADGDEKEKYLWLLLQTYISLSVKTGDYLVDQFPESVHAHILKGEVLDRKGLYRLAAREYLSAATLDPDYATTFFLLAPDLERLSLDSLARVALERYSKLVGATPNSDLLSVEAGLTGQEVKDSFDYASPLRNLPPITKSKPAPFPLADSQVNRSALNSSTAADWTGVYLRAAAYLWRDQPLEADRTLAQYPIQLERTPALLKLQWESFERIAAGYANELLQRFPTSAGAHFLRAQALDAKGSQEAENEYKLAIAADPRRSEIRVALAELYIANSSLPAAEQLLKQELAINRYSAAANARLGEIYLKLNNAPEAVRYLQAAAASDSQDASLHSNLGAAWERRGDYHKAVGEYERSLELNPAQNRLHFVLSALYGRLGQSDLAKQEFARFQAVHDHQDQEILEQARVSSRTVLVNPK